MKPKLIKARETLLINRPGEVMVRGWPQRMEMVLPYLQMSSSDVSRDGHLSHQDTSQAVSRGTSGRIRGKEP